ncbi:MAG TPA: HDOD domain-containing protein, partial [Polyangiaceae bacterium]|nr:HDOD domain-containing protein [Polyangiaceae bacterium]
LLEQLQRDLARGTSDLPTLPRSVTEALRLARTPGLDFAEVERVAASDPPLSARVVSVANSALYARAGMPRIASVRRAAVRLGTQATRDVLFQVAYASMFVDAPRFRDLVEATFQHGVRAARCARLLAREQGLDADIAFLSGLLHDIGRARCWKLLAKQRGTIDLASAATAVEGLHAVAGAELASAWHLPEEVVEACRWHHEPGGRDYAMLIAAADAVARLDEGRGTRDDALERLLEAQVPPERADDLVAKALKETRAPDAS